MCTMTTEYLQLLSSDVFHSKGGKKTKKTSTFSSTSLETTKAKIIFVNKHDLSYTAQPS